MSSVAQQIFEEIQHLPPQLQQETLDFVRFLIHKQRKLFVNKILNEINGPRLAQLMVEMATRGTAFQDIHDPVAWQKDVRQDRPIFGRAVVAPSNEI